MSEDKKLLEINNKLYVKQAFYDLTTSKSDDNDSNDDDRSVELLDDVKPKAEELLEEDMNMKPKARVLFPDSAATSATTRVLFADSAAMTTPKPHVPKKRRGRKSTSKKASKPKPSKPFASSSSTSMQTTLSLFPREITIPKVTPRTASKKAKSRSEDGGVDEYVEEAKKEAKETQFDVELTERTAVSFGVCKYNEMICILYYSNVESLTIYLPYFDRWPKEEAFPMSRTS